MAEEILNQIKTICNQNNVPEPNIYSEFGIYTVGEAGAIFYKILDQKQQNDRELWDMINSLFYDYSARYLGTKSKIYFITP